MTLRNASGKYHVFHRTWWKDNAAWPNGLEPEPGEKHTIGWADTESEARVMAKKWSLQHPPGRYSDKGEYEEE